MTFSDAKAKVITILNPYILFLTSEEIMAILKNCTFSSLKLDVLGVIANTLKDASAENKQKIVDEAFAFSADKSKAQAILADIKSRNCIFGTVTEKSLAFVIDISPSMQYTFKTSDGATSTRLAFVKQ